MDTAASAAEDCSGFPGTIGAYCMAKSELTVDIS